MSSDLHKPNINETPNANIPVEIINILIQLVHTAHNKGVYTLDQSYLAFSAINSTTNNPQYKKTHEFVENLLKKTNINYTIVNK